MNPTHTAHRRSKEVEYEQLAQAHIRSRLEEKIGELEDRVDELEQ